ncbi:glycosyltransferase family 2 protein [Calditrichota bacterium LG25]
MPIPYDIVIPAYNAHNELPVLLKQIDLLIHKPQKIYIIDDGSKKSYSFPEFHNLNVHIYRYEHNRGKGMAIRKGLELFLNNNDTPFLLLMDADGQHPVQSIPDFLKKAQTQPFDLLIGNRVERVGKMPLLRIFSNTVSSLIVSWVTGERIVDSQCGFRLLRRRLIENIQLKEKGFQVETELIIKSAKHGYKIGFIPIPTIYNGQKSNIKHFSDTVRFIQIIIKEILSR